MNSGNIPASTSELQFFPRMQTISDTLSDRYELYNEHISADTEGLKGIRRYQIGKPVYPPYLYILSTEDITPAFSFQEKRHYLVIGTGDIGPLPVGCCVMQIGQNANLNEIMNDVQEVFEMYQKWDRDLHVALEHRNPIDAIIEASLPIFDNPIFIHDEDFYILASPTHVAGMSVWVRDPRNGKLMAPLSLIDDFKSDMEYLQTLNTHGPRLFSRNLRGYQILYINLWVDHIYRGRICVNEMHAALKKSHYMAIEYLGKFAEIILQRHFQFRLNAGRDLRDFFSDILDGTIKNEQEILPYLEILSWKRDDKYLFLRLENLQNRKEMVSSAATLGQIENQIPDGSAFLSHGGISVVVNLSVQDSSVSRVISSLAIIIREGLYKMGVSQVFRDFLLIPQACEQARAAIRIGQQENNMLWCYRFQDYLLEYILSSSTQAVSAKMLCSRPLLLLEEYDRENGTELLRTLEIYLKNERNALKTANDLFIHRSSLFHRLKRIRTITGINLDDAKERLLLLLSYELMP